MPTVTIACKLPHGLRLRLHEWAEVQEPVLGGGTRIEKRARPTGQEVVVKGVAHEASKSPDAPMAFGYALTHGVDADFWEKWVAQNKGSTVLEGGMTFAHAKPADAEAHAREGRAVRSGLEPLDPNNLPMKGVQTAPESAKPLVIAG